METIVLDPQVIGSNLVPIKVIGSGSYNYRIRPEPNPLTGLYGRTHQAAYDSDAHFTLESFNLAVSLKGLR